MRKKIFFFFAFIICYANCIIAQENYYTASVAKINYLPTNEDVIHIKEVHYDKVTNLKESTTPILKLSNEHTFKGDWLVQSKRYRSVTNTYGISNYAFADNYKTYTVEYHNLKNGVKSNASTTKYKNFMFRTLPFYFPENSTIVTNTENKLELNYTMQGGAYRVTIQRNEDNTVKVFHHTPYGPTIYTYDELGVLLKSNFPGLHGFTFTYDKFHLPILKEQFGSAFKNPATDYFHEKDNKGNWVKRIAIEYTNKGFTSLTYSARQLTYQNGTTTGSTAYDKDFAAEAYASFETAQTLLGTSGTEQPSQKGCVSGNCVNGKGKFVWNDGGTYTGEFKNSKLNGNGTYIVPNEGKWEGTFVNDDITYGKLYYKDGRLLYEGEFKNFMRHGKGTSYTKDNAKIIGNYVQNKHEGKSEILYANGNKAEGNYIDGKQEGEGIFYDYKENKKYTDMYKNGKFVKTIRTEWINPPKNSTKPKNEATKPSISTTASAFQGQITTCKQAANPDGCIVEEFDKNLTEFKKSGKTQTEANQNAANNLRAILQYNYKPSYKAAMKIPQDKLKDVLLLLTKEERALIKKSAQEFVNEYQKTHH